MKRETLKCVMDDDVRVRERERDGSPFERQKAEGLCVRECSAQCDQIGQFIGLWATFKSFWPQLICPNLPHS